MSVRNQGHVCWNCGLEGVPFIGSKWICYLCEVTWFPIWTEVHRLNDVIRYNNWTLPVVDFTDPLAPSSPA